MRRRGEGVSLLKETLDVEVEAGGTVPAAGNSVGAAGNSVGAAGNSVGAAGNSVGAVLNAETAADEIALEPAADKAEPESAGARRRPARARSRVELTAAAAGWRDAAARRVTRLGAALQRDRTELLAGAVLALAVLAALTSWGALDIGGAASEPAPVVSGYQGD